MRATRAPAWREQAGFPPLISSTAARQIIRIDPTIPVHPRKAKCPEMTLSSVMLRNTDFTEFIYNITTEYAIDIIKHKMRM
jgi:hypothetical protein